LVLVLLLLLLVLVLVLPSFFPLLLILLHFGLLPQFHPEMTEEIAEELFGKMVESKAAPVIHQHPTADWSLSSRIALNFLQIVSDVNSISSSQVSSPPLLSQSERKEHRSIHTAGIGEVHLMPMSVITRPLESNLDEEKVRSLMETLVKEEEEGIAGTSQSKVPAIDVLWVEKPSPSSNKKNYYFSFGGCHRYEAHKRLGRTNILAKLVKTDESAVRAHLGLSLSLLDH
jgi:sulfiredoxin